MNMKKVLLIFVLTLSFVLDTFAQISVEATIDSLQILTGEQAKISLEVALDADKTAILPIFVDTIVKGVEIVDISKPDTQYINDNKRMTIKEVYTITSFDSALYYLPPIEVLVDSQKYSSKPLALKVYSMPVDTLHPEVFFGPKGIIAPDFVWADWYLAIFGCILFAPLLVLLWFLAKRIRDNKPIVRKIKVEPKIPPHEQAIKEIERIKSEKIWQKGLSKEYYTQLTETLRNYIQGRFGFNAMEMTTDEIIKHLTDVNDDDAISELKMLLQTADLVKFAKFMPMMNENDINLLNAVRFINGTKISEAPGTKEPTEITIVEKRSLRTKIFLGLAIITIVVLVIWIAVYVCTQIYDYVA